MRKSWPLDVRTPPQGHTAGLWHTVTVRFNSEVSDPGSQLSLPYGCLLKNEWNSNQSFSTIRKAAKNVHWGRGVERNGLSEVFPHHLWFSWLCDGKLLDHPASLGLLNWLLFQQLLMSDASQPLAWSFFLAVVVQSLRCVQLFVTPWTAAHQASLSFTISQSVLKLMSIESVTPSNHLILCHPFLLLPSIFPSIRSFPMSWLFTSGGQNIGTSASVSVLPKWMFRVGFL